MSGVYYGVACQDASQQRYFTTPNGGELKAKRRGKKPCSKTIFPALDVKCLLVYSSKA
jgi:hypothetical protein